MVKRTNLRSQNVTKRHRQVNSYGTQTPLSSAAVERGSTRWLSGSRVDIEGILNLIGTGNVTGRLNVGGVLDVTGTLNGSGTNNFSGTNNLTGVNHLVGPTDVAGNFEIISGGQFKAGESLIYPDGSAKFGALGIASDGTMQAGLFELRPDGSANFGTLEILPDGTLNVSNDINVLNNGKIIAGQVEIWPDNIGMENAGITSGPLGFRFTGTNSRNAIVESLGGNAELTAGGSTVTVRAGAIDLTAPQVHVSEYLNVKGRLVTRERVVLLGTPTAAAGVTANVHMDSNGYLWKVP